MRKPNLFLIGGPKCGTTSFQGYLAAHPQIFMSTPKEPCYFDMDLPWPSSPRNEREYMRCFAGVRDEHVIIGEASTNYLYSKVAVRNIMEFNPDARFIVMVRNPIDMARSLHSYSLQNLTEDVSDFETAWNLQAMRKRGEALPKVNYQPDFVLYGEFCKLGEQIERLFKTVPRERVHVIVFDDLVKNASDAYVAALGFLGLAPEGENAFPARNVTGAPRSLIAHSALMSLLAIRKRIPIRRIGGGVFNRLIELNTGEARREKLRSEFRTQLVEYFRSDVALLSGHLQRDFSAWLKELPKGDSGGPSPRDRSELSHYANQ